MKKVIDVQIFNRSCDFRYDGSKGFKVERINVSIFFYIAGRQLPDHDIVVYGVRGK